MLPKLRVVFKSIHVSALLLKLKDIWEACGYLQDTTNTTLVINHLDIINDSIGPIPTVSLQFSDLHWLPVYQRNDFKILQLAFKALNGLEPKYISNLVILYYIMNHPDLLGHKGQIYLLSLDSVLNMEKQSSVFMRLISGNKMIERMQVC